MNDHSLKRAECLSVPTFFIDLPAMRISRKHTNYLKVLGFFTLLGLMVLLNSQMGSDKQNEQENSTQLVSEVSKHEGLAPLTAKVPGHTERSIPIKLISNPNSVFLVFVNYSYEFKAKYRIVYQKKKFLQYYGRLQKVFICEYLLSARNKDIK